MNLRFVIYLPLLLLTACASQPPEKPDPSALAAERGYTIEEEVRDIKNYEIDGWQYVSNWALIIPARPSSHYLVMLDRNCSYLRGTEAIRFTSTVNSVLARFDAVLVKDFPQAIEQRCQIDRIYRITKS
jgi:hypothetical protein